LFKTICNMIHIEAPKNSTLSPVFEFNPLSIFLSCYRFFDTSIHGFPATVVSFRPDASQKCGAGGHWGL
jgi:hypothetical protein